MTKSTDTTKSSKSMLDLSASIGFDAIADEFKKLGVVDLVGYTLHTKENPFHADISGGRGKYSYTVQGADRPYTCGADDLVKLCRAVGVKGPMIDDDIIIAFRNSKHFSNLKNANSRHK